MLDRRPRPRPLHDSPSYGTVKPPWLAEFIERSATSLNGCWVRVLFCGSQGSQNAWIGRIANDTRQIFGGTSGMQAITAYGPQNILRRISVSRSYWMVSEGAVSRRVEIGWLPPVNETHGRTDRDKSSGSHADKRFETSRSGNRSEKHDGNHYLHGGEELWTYRQYCEYLLAMFVDDSAQNGPTWRLDGQIEALDLFTEPIEWGVVVTVDQMLRRLISPALGLDYKIVETGDGFAVRVFSLVSQSCGWGEHTIPANPDTVTVEAGQTVTNVQTQIERSSDHRYGTIRALGGRTVACGSLTPKAATLTRGWRYELEAQYNAGTGVSTDAPYLHDLARHQEKFRDVYRRWIFREQSALFDKIVEFDGNGQPTEKHRNQRRARSTLPWLPLDADADYSQEPPEDLAATSTTWLGASLRRPQVWLCDDASAETLVFTPAAAAGIGVSVLPTALGIFLHTTPNHLVGGYSFYGSTETPAKYNQDDIVATLAWHTDQRMFCEQKTADAGTSDGVLEIDCSIANCGSCCRPRCWTSTRIGRWSSRPITRSSCETIGHGSPRAWPARWRATIRIEPGHKSPFAAYCRGPR